MEHGLHGDSRAFWQTAVSGLGVAVLASSVFLLSPALATHEIDHRFTVDGYVCGPDGRPIPDVHVIVKDTRVSQSASGFTDDRGYYKAVLHLHNENRGDPILVKTRGQEQRVTAQFDPQDLGAERIVRVNFGAGCALTEAGEAEWWYYGVGVAAVAALLGAGLWQKQRRMRRKGKDKRR